MTSLTKIGRYEILEVLGQGAMGVVYKASDPLIKRVVAVKTIRRTTDPSGETAALFAERFIHEAQAAGALHHPNIVAVYDAGTDPESGIPYIAMEHVAGTTVENELRKGRVFSTREIVSIGVMVAEGLHFAHARGIVHRDIKPGNLLLDSSSRVKIADFGIARLPGSDLTRTGQFLGTPHYSSPEQMTGHPVDVKSDMFSLGVVLYQMATGNRPFAGDSVAAVVYQIVNADPTPPRAANPSVSPELERVLLKILSKSPAARYPDCEALAQALRQVSAAGQTAQPEPPPPPSAPAAPVQAAAPPAGSVIPAGETRDGRDPKTLAGNSAEDLQPTASAPAVKRRQVLSGTTLWFALGALALVIAAVVFLSPGGLGGLMGGPDATLRIRFNHHISSGSYTVMLDGKEVISGALRARKTRQVLPGVKVSREEIDRTVPIPSGNHRIEVRVAADSPGFDAVDTTSGTFEKDKTRTLRIEVQRVTNKMDIRLE